LVESFYSIFILNQAYFILPDLLDREKMENVLEVSKIKAKSNEMPIGFFKYELTRKRVKVNNITKIEFNLQLAKIPPNGKIAKAKAKKELNNIPVIGPLIGKMQSWIAKDKEMEPSYPLTKNEIDTGKNKNKFKQKLIEMNEDSYIQIKSLIK